MASFEECSYMT